MMGAIIRVLTIQEFFLCLWSSFAEELRISQWVIQQDKIKGTIIII